MKKAILLVILLSCIVMATAPQFGPFSWIEDNGGRIDVGNFGAPCIVDWDGDGLKDLVLGEFILGRIRFYANSNSNDSPVFTNFSYVQSDGVDIVLPYG
ncbi:MAG: hypothetical protein KAQ97_01250 [Candidatus Fermentibacteraceae bacterium]|nr:hypothetical protein [Candidatus Fermentibacteraceae bacterium]